MPDKSEVSSASKARRSIVAGSLLALSAGGTVAPAISALQGGSIILGAVLGAYSVFAAIVAFTSLRGAFWWLKLAKAEQPRTDVTQAIALSDAREHMVYASVGNDPKERDLAKAELRAAMDMKVDRP